MWIDSVLAAHRVNFQVHSVVKSNKHDVKYEPTSQLTRHTDQIFIHLLFLSLFFIFEMAKVVGMPRYNKNTYRFFRLIPYQNFNNHRLICGCLQLRLLQTTDMLKLHFSVLYVWQRCAQGSVSGGLGTKTTSHRNERAYAGFSKSRLTHEKTRKHLTFSHCRETISPSVFSVCVTSLITNAHSCSYTSLE